MSAVLLLKSFRGIGRPVIGLLLKVICLPLHLGYYTSSILGPIVRPFVPHIPGFIVYGSISIIILGGLGVLVQRLCDALHLHSKGQYRAANAHGRIVAQGMTEASQQFDRTIRHAIESGAQGVDRLEYIVRDHSERIAKGLVT